MKKYLVIPILFFASCADRADKKADEPKQSGAYCFLLTEGTGGQDTTTVHLMIDADKVSGEMDWLPKEKDRRKGTLAGTIAGNEIAAVWTFMQEGVMDSIHIAFKLLSEQLTQKPLKINTANGRQETDETAGYTISYKPVDCKM